MPTGYSDPQSRVYSLFHSPISRMFNMANRERHWKAEYVAHKSTLSQGMSAVLQECYEQVLLGVCTNTCSTDFFLFSKTGAPSSCRHTHTPFANPTPSSHQVNQKSKLQYLKPGTQKMKA